MTCAILEIGLKKKKKKKWYTWIVGHLLNQKNNSKVNRIVWKEPTAQMQFNHKLKCTCVAHVDYWQTWLAGLRSREENGANSNFCQTIYRHCVFIFSSCSCVIYRWLTSCKNNPHMFHFLAVCSISVLQHFKWSSTHKGGRHPGERYWKTMLTMEKENTEILCCTS